MSEKVKIDNNAPLQVGDVIEMDFSIYGPTWLRAAELAIFEEHIKNNPRYYLVNWSIDDSAGTLAMTIKIIEPQPVPGQVQQAGVITAAAIIAAAAAILGIFYWLSLDGTYKLVQTPAVQAASYGMLIFAIAYLVLAWRKK